MKVRLINVAEYDIKQDKVSEIPFESFVNLCGGIMPHPENSDSKVKMPTVRLFKTISEFCLLSQEEVDEIDSSQNIRILNNGQFLVFLKEEDNSNETKVTADATADTKENKRK